MSQVPLNAVRAFDAVVRSGYFKAAAENNPCEGEPVNSLLWAETGVDSSQQLGAAACPEGGISSSAQDAADGRLVLASPWRLGKILPLLCFDLPAAGFGSQLEAAGQDPIFSGKFIPVASDQEVGWLAAESSQAGDVRIFDPGGGSCGDDSMSCSSFALHPVGTGGWGMPFGAASAGGVAGRRLLSRADASRAGVLPDMVIFDPGG